MRTRFGAGDGERTAGPAARGHGGWVARAPMGRAPAGDIAAPIVRPLAMPALSSSSLPALHPKPAQGDLQRRARIGPEEPHACGAPLPPELPCAGTWRGICRGPEQPSETYGLQTSLRYPVLTRHSAFSASGVEATQPPPPPGAGRKTTALGSSL